MPWSSPLKPHDDRLFWAWNVGFWVAAFGGGLIIAKAFAPGLPTPEWFVGQRVLIGFGLSAALRRLSKRDDIRRRMGISQAGLMIGGPVAGGVLMTLFMTAIDRLGDEPSVRLGLLARVVLNTAVLATWSAMYFGIRLLRETQSNELRAFEAESLAFKNELRLLQSQISPHFLFNALNTILACKHQPEAIETVTHSLGNYLRYLLRQSDALEPLGREIDAIEEYLTIQSFRFGDRLVCRIDCESDVRGIPVIPMMVQPLVENALKYGTASENAPLELHIRAWREADRLLIDVSNTGRLGNTDQSLSTGTGLQTLRRRLLLHGGPDASLSIGERDGRVHARLSLPLTARYAAPRHTAAPPPTDAFMEAAR